MKRHLRSYKFSVRGIRVAFREDPNMYIHLIASIMVILMNWLCRVNKMEWLLTLILIGLVWMAEVFNTSLEKVADRVNPDFDEKIRNVKDLASAAVFIICLVAVTCAAIIYIPYITGFTF